MSWKGQGERLSNIIKCDLCGHTGSESECKREGWLKVDCTSMSEVFRFSYTFHYCARCKVLYNNGVHSASAEYEKLKGTEWDRDKDKVEE